MADYVFLVGDVVRRGWEIRNADGDLTSATVAVSIVEPDGVTQTPTPTNPSTGIYEVDFPPTKVGLHQIIWTATGAQVASDNDSFYVRANVAPIISLAEAKAQLNWSSAATAEDESELVGFIHAASDACEAYTQRRWRRQTFTEVHNGGTTVVSLDETPVVSITSVTENGVSVAPTGYTFTPIGGQLSRLSGTYTRQQFAYGFRNVEVTYVAGIAVIPDDVRRGVANMVKHLWETQRGSVRMPMNQGGDDYAFIQSATYALPRRVAELWEPYRDRLGFA